MYFVTENNNKRNKYIAVRGKALSLPIFFPSISSIKTNLTPYSYFKILIALGQQHFLVSAYDIAKSAQRNEFIDMMRTNQKTNGPIILMDSGNYESYWMRDKAWDLNGFNEILSQNISDLAFCFDNQSPPNDASENALNIAKATSENQKATITTTIIPIIHCKKERLNENVLALYNQTNFTMISIPERILGDGILERLNTVTNLRKELNKLDNYIHIHLLGTGNPLSLLLFALAGADSFDGLEWCQTVVNSKSSLLYHFQQREFIRDNCDFCNSAELDYTLTTFGHNIIFYNSWMKEIQSAIEHKSEIDMLKLHFDDKFIGCLTKMWS